VADYSIWIEDAAKRELQSAPRHIRQRLKQAIADLAHEPRPFNSRHMTPPPDFAFELRRIRIEKWRIVYLIDEAEAGLGVYAIRRRPPYSYNDLAELLAGLQ
jgi:mRNA-degrading endonuclease RelE of RelBE toxin-antitoxin system